MSFPKISWALFLLGTLMAFHWSGTAIAEEKAAESGKKEEKKEEKDKKSEPEWASLNVEISTLEANMRQHREVLEKLIEEKQKAKEDSPELKEIVDQMVKENKKLQEATEEFNKKNIILKFRYPERTAKEGERHYQHVDVKTLEQVERELSTDGRLNRNMEKIRQQYPDSQAPKSPANAAAIKDSSAPVGKKKAQSIDEAGSVILKDQDATKDQGK